MLQSINDKAKGWVAYTIVGLIAVPFALVGISSYLDGSNGLVAAEVNGEEISVQQVQGVVLQQRQRLSQMFGGQLPPSINQEVIVNQALDQVVNQVLLRQESENNGYRASNQEVFDVIAEMEAFKTNGQFDALTYEKLLLSQRRSKAEFEGQIRESLTNQQFTQAVTTAAFLPKSEIANYQRIQTQTRDVETFTLKTADYESEVSVSEDEIKADFDANLANYMTNEKVKLNYVLLKQDDIAANLSTEDDVLLAFYEENESRYIDPEKRQIAHILVKIVDDKKEEAKEKAQALYDQIQAGSATFEDLAVSSSDDEEASKNNGELGTIGQGEQGVLFDEAAFAPTLLKGAMTEVVETEAGYAIIKVLDVIASKAKPFAEVKSEVEVLYKNEEAEKLFIEQSDSLQTLAFENDSGLEEAADSVGVELVTSDWLEKNAPLNADNPLSAPNVIAAAFSDEVLNSAKNSELIELDAKTVVVIRVEEHELPKQKELASVKEDIEKALSAKKLKELLVEKGDAALKLLSESGSWAELESIGATEEEVKKSTIERDDSSLARNVVNKIFSMQKPDSGKTFDKSVLANGDNVLILLSGVSYKVAEDDAVLQQRYTQSVAQREQAAILASLKEKAEIKLFVDNIQ